VPKIWKNCKNIRHLHQKEEKSRINWSHLGGRISEHLFYIANTSRPVLWMFDSFHWIVLIVQTIRGLLIPLTFEPNPWHPPSLNYNCTLCCDFLNDDSLPIMPCARLLFSDVRSELYQKLVRWNALHSTVSSLSSDCTNWALMFPSSLSLQIRMWVLLRLTCWFLTRKMASAVASSSRRTHVGFIPGNCSNPT
jgi:hypothetical protein